VKANKMGWNVHTHIGIPPSVGSLATNIQGRISPFATKMQRRIASLGTKANKGMVANLTANWIQNAIPAVAVPGGGVAFGFWQDSASAGLFACFALFLLAGIYKALRQIVATHRWQPDRTIAANASENTSRIAERSEPNFEISAEAIEHLLPWVKDETPLTEESAKAYCSVLLDTLAALHPKCAK
jgi:polygalacturonase